MDICKVPLAAKLIRGALSMTGLWKEKSLSSKETEVKSPEESCCRLTLECHSRVMGPSQQKLDAGI